MDNSVYNWMKEWVDLTSNTKYENSFNENSDEWTEIEGIGKFKGLEIVTENHEDIGNITITLKYDEWEKILLNKQ